MYSAVGDADPLCHSHAACTSSVGGSIFWFVPLRRGARQRKAVVAADGRPARDDRRPRTEWR